MGKRRHSLLIKYLNPLTMWKCSIAILICNHTYWKAMKTLGVDTSAAAAYSACFNWCWILLTTVLWASFAVSTKNNKHNEMLDSTQLAPHNQHWQAQHQLNWTSSKRPKILDNPCIVSQQKDQQLQLLIYTSTDVLYCKMLKPMKKSETHCICVSILMSIIGTLKNGMGVLLDFTSMLMSKIKGFFSCWVLKAKQSYEVKKHPN